MTTCNTHAERANYEIAKDEIEERSWEPDYVMRHHKHQI